MTTSGTGDEQSGDLGMTKDVALASWPSQPGYLLDDGWKEAFHSSSKFG